MTRPVPGVMTGIPPGVVNLVVGGADAGQALTEHPDVDMVSFTGSVNVGRQVMVQAAHGLKRVVLELGGKSPNIVLPGADVSQTVGPSILRFTRNSGQGCGATTRSTSSTSSTSVQIATRASSTAECGGTGARLISVVRRRRLVDFSLAVIPANTGLDQIAVCLRGS